jgi:RNA polymerase sigma-70 factor (ECF subfamily)
MVTVPAKKKREQRWVYRNIIDRDLRIRHMESINNISLPALAASLASPDRSEIECEVLRLFEEFRNPLLRYAHSFGISVHDAEEVIQEVFLALFLHLQSDKSRKNLRGWLFRVAHNQALRKRTTLQQVQTTSFDWMEAHMQADPSPNPEERLFADQRTQRLVAVLRVLPETDQYCLRLRAEGLRYREIASVLGMSLGAVSISLTRSLGRLLRADRS